MRSNLLVTGLFIVNKIKNYQNCLTEISPTLVVQILHNQGWGKGEDQFHFVHW